MHDDRHYTMTVLQRPKTVGCDVFMSVMISPPTDQKESHNNNKEKKDVIRKKTGRLPRVGK